MPNKRSPSLPFASPLSPSSIPPAFAEQVDIGGFEDSDADLPFPTPLPRQPFVSSDFSPADFLASLSRNRHQTLADLRSDLQARSAAISGELHTLVNDEYAAFLSLGAALQGGEEKCQEVKVGVLGFEKGITSVRDSVIERRKALERLLSEREDLVREISKGRAIIAMGERLRDLESVLEDGEWESEDEDDDDDDDDDDNGVNMVAGVGRLNRLVQAYVGTETQMAGLCEDMHPNLLTSFNDRLKNIQATLLIDLGTALKQAKALGAKGSSRLLKILTLYGDLGATQEALNVMKMSEKT